MLDIRLSSEQLALRDQLRRYFAELMTPERRAALSSHEPGGAAYRAVVRQLGADGWLGVGWPKEYGGQGRSPIEQFIFFDEAQRASVPIPMVTLNTVGPTLMRFGSDGQRRFFLPPILRGEMHFAIGYSEPGAGTDLASLRTRAVRDGEEYVIDGSKIFTTGGDDADYIWLAVRTDPDAPKHKGISIFLVDTSLPGFSAVPLPVMGGGHTNYTFYEDVRVPLDALVGEENQGWRMITTQLNHERVALAPSGQISHLFESVLAWARQTETASGARVIDEEWVRVTLARVHARVEALKLFNWKVAWGLSTADPNPADASAMKVFGSELRIEACDLLVNILGESGYLPEGSPGAVLRGQLEQVYRSAPVTTFGGGVNEVQREIIAGVGLGMPRAPR
jgi:alkylation response protein AidB-like acyl-CoA dehydrogenase